MIYRNHLTTFLKSILSLVSSILLLVHSAHADINDGLVAYYKFDGNARDEVSSANNGTLVGGASFATGISGQAIDFDGVDDFIQIDNKQMIQSSNFTVTAWVYQYAVDFPIFTQWTAHTSEDNFLFQIAPEDSLNLGLRSGSARHFYSQVLVAPTGEWKFVAVSYDNTSQTGLFVVDGTSESFSTPITDRRVDISNEIFIGKLETSSFHYANGKVDELRVYNRALNEAEIQEVYEHDPIVENEPFNYVALGDSYSSGEGIGECQSAWNNDPFMRRISVQN